MWFLSGYVDRWYGAAMVTPNCMPHGMTVWIGKLIFTASWDPDTRGFDLYFGDRELFRWDFK